MVRSLSALLVVLTAFGVSAQEKKDDATPKKPFPLAKGTKWVYALKGAEDYPWEHVVTNVSKPNKGERAVVTVTYTFRDLKKEYRYSVDETAVYEHTRGGTELDAPLVMIKLPLKAGTKWTEQFKYVGDVTAEYEVNKAEEVKVSAGTFTAYPVVQSIKTELGKSTVTTWYADGVGMVKQEIKAFGKPDVIELKSFEPVPSK